MAISRIGPPPPATEGPEPESTKPAVDPENRVEEVVPEEVVPEEVVPEEVVVVEKVKVVFGVKTGFAPVWTSMERSPVGDEMD
jgi:hypothetical protein